MSLVILALVACKGGDDAPVDSVVEPAGLALLGSYSHDPAAVRIETLLTSDDRIGVPGDLAINPRTPDQLWVTNYDANAIVLATGLESGTIESDYFRSGGGDHFLAKPLGIAFNDVGEFATVHDTDELTQGPNGTPEDFMGPTLWDDNLAVFDAGHGSHLDMLHNSPLAGGVAWEVDRAFWVFDGFYSALTRYDFNSDHGYGGADHSDGEIARYVEGEVGRYEGTPSGLDLDHDSGLLYVADSANSRVAVLDIQTGERGSRVGPNYDGVSQYAVDGASLTTLFQSGDHEVLTLVTPAGLVFHDGVLYVSDNELGRILALSADGEVLDWLDLGLAPGALGNLEVDTSGNLLFIDMAAAEVRRISPAL
ncbi:MAG: hypothetical protein H6741_27585 [Alphaproteobacteria bacterium]|nr:hypothetical protein [Alphaproteobacteria bacterium]